MVVPTATMRRPAARAASTAAAASSETAYGSLWSGWSARSVDGHRPEGIESDAEGHLHHLVAGAHPLEQRRGEVEPGGRRGGRPGVAGVHRLVALGIVRRPADVRRQRHLPHLLECTQNRHAPRDGARHAHIDQHTAVTLALQDRDREIAGGQGLAVPQPPHGPGERLPAAVACGLEQEHLDRAAARPARTHPHRQHPGVVQDDEVVRAELIQEVGEATVPDRPRRAVVHHEPCAVARLGGRLRDQGRGKVVVEFVGAHRIV